MSDKHEERASRVEDELHLRLTGGDLGYLAEQFREVEREAAAEAVSRLGTWATVATARITPEQLRAIVRAGDALRKLADYDEMQEDAAAWDAATKGVERG